MVVIRLLGFKSAFHVRPDSNFSRSRKTQILFVAVDQVFTICVRDLVTSSLLTGNIEWLSVLLLLSSAYILS
jgi:hypothetical protein